MLFEMILMKFDSNELFRVETFLGPFVLTLFILLVVFICLSIFLSIINDNFRLAREKVIEDPEVFSYIIKTFFQWIGIKKRPEWEIQEEKDQQMRENYFSTTDTLRLRTNQLVNQINRMYFNQQTTNV
ncbi:unnamed protein product [Adineta ricciae]|uniref:Polycystin cation channel PKD1/PKD2 domain-containing protein n=2 Tax=Adineta ricciae TaxID=249248 RepID=A0A815WRT1_ADIRI|nr:unnamed protein product [Adineta ricciae]